MIGPIGAALSLSLSFSLSLFCACCFVSIVGCDWIILPVIYAAVV